MGCTTSTHIASAKWLDAMVAWSVTVDLNNQAAAEYAFTDTQLQGYKESFDIIANEVGIAINDHATGEMTSAREAEYTKVMDDYDKLVTNYEFAKKAHAMARENHLSCFRKVTNAAALVKRCE
jgi:hypothetical protein